MSFPSKIKTFRKTINNLGNKVIIFFFFLKVEKGGTTLEHRKHTRETPREKDANSIAPIY